MLNDRDYKILTLEKHPHRLDTVIKAIQREAGTIHPHAAAFSLYGEDGHLVCPHCGEPRTVDQVVKNKPCEKCESMPLSVAGALARGRESLRDVREALAVASAPGDAPIAPPPAVSGIAKVILISEGLGNRRDMNYYGPEAMASACAVFDGKQCALNHMGEAEEKNRPEGDVEKVIGYYKNLHVETVTDSKGRKLSACCGELHFDLSQEGRNAYEKSKTAVQYNKDFPNSEEVYFGLSINAAGRSETREMVVDGETVEVNYVLEFEYGRSVDAVTMPGRGGKFVALVESISGANPKEVQMIHKNLKAAIESLRKAEGEKDAEMRKQKVNEALKVLESLEAEVAAVEAKKGKKEDETEDEAEARKKAEDEAKDKEEEAKKALPKADAKDDEDEDEKESRVLIAKALITESKLPEGLIDVNDLAKLPLKEAKAKIEETRRISNVISKQITESLGRAPAFHGGKILESATEGTPANADGFSVCE